MLLAILCPVRPILFACETRRRLQTSTNSLLPCNVSNIFIFFHVLVVSSSISISFDITVHWPPFFTHFVGPGKGDSDTLPSHPYGADRGQSAFSEGSFSGDKSLKFTVPLVYMSPEPSSQFQTERATVGLKKWPQMRLSLRVALPGMCLLDESINHNVRNEP